MNNRFLTITILLISSTLTLEGCSGDNSSFTDPAVTNAVSNEVQTQVPDQNSLTISAEKIAVEALNYNGEAVVVTALVADRNNNPVPDNTAIRFLTNGGSIEPQCLTVNGACTVTWTEQYPTPGVNAPGNFEAIIIGYTSGEESFTDLNDNGLYDAGEPFTDISEPFFDINNNGTRDANTEEFIDADLDNTFDTADGLFTGTPCIGDNTVCNRVSTLIWGRRDIVLSSGSAAITQLTGTFPTTDDTTAIFTFSITDVNGKVMADGTTVAISTTGGSVTTTSIDLAPGQTNISIQYTTATPVGNDSITIEVTSPKGFVKSTTF